VARALVTGLGGFTGGVLAPVLADRGFEVVGTTAPEQAGSGAAADALPIDLLDFAALHTLVKRLQPDVVVHLAAVSLVAHGDVDATYRTNIVGTQHLLRALVEACPTPPRHVILASSANIYGNSEHDPITEDAPPRPANDYAVSKLAMEHMAALWRERLPITIARPFNYTGRGQSSRFLVPKIVEAHRHRDSVLELGNLDVERDFCDVRDVARAYADLLEGEAGGVFNLCSGRVASLREVLDLARELSGHAPQVRVNPSFVRSNEVHRLRGSNARLLARLPGWQARPLRETISWMLSV
jgi:nucleoside-diphosphate-sugar epimerase